MVNLKKEGTVILANNNHFLLALRNLMERKEITLDQYATSLRRAKNSIEPANNLNYYSQSNLVLGLAV